MTTDNRTNEPTPEQIIEDALRNSYASGSALARLIASDLHAHGLLSGGAPTEAQIERVRGALREHRGADYGKCSCGWPEGGVSTSIGCGRHQAEVALTAAGIAPQEPKCEHGIALIDLCQFADHVANDAPTRHEYAAPVLPSSGVDEEKLAEAIEQARDRSRKDRDITKESLGQYIARAVAEWLKGQGNAARG